MSRFTTFGLTILLAFVPAALAADGTVLINQSTITNGLPGCPTLGHFPINICQPGSYRLSGNITVTDANTSAISIFVDNVTLDLNGFAILGPGTCVVGTFPVQCSSRGTGVGIFSTNNNIALSNGAVNGLGTGVFLVGFGTMIDGLRVANNTDPSEAGIVADHAAISNCTVTTNAGTGIFTRTDTTVNLSHISFNGGFGIGGNGTGLIAINNSVIRNGQDGMNNVTLAVNNTFFQNVGFGFSCLDANCSFESNAFLGNQGGVAKNGTSLGHNSSNGVVF